MNINDTLMEAQASQRAGEHARAAVSFRAILDAEPDNADALYGLGTVHLHQGDTAGACTYLQRAVQLMPDVPEFNFNLAVAEEQAGRVDAAAVRLQRAAVLAAGDAALLARICSKLQAMGRDRELLAAVAASRCRDASVLAMVAGAHLRQGNWAGACAVLRQVVGARPDDRGAWRALATATARMRDFTSAITAFDRYLQLADDDAADQLAYADLLLMARRPHEAAAAVREALDRGADNADAQYLAARCDRLAGDYAVARHRLHQATAARPDYGSAWWLLVELEDGSEALHSIAEKCSRLARDPATPQLETVQLALSAGRALERLGRYEAAFAEIDFGNAQQRARLDARGTEYDPSAMESFISRMSRLFPQPLPTVESTAGAPAPIFIVGLPRSGTTVVERMLTSLDGVEAGGENEAMEFVAARYYWELEHGRLPAPEHLSPAQRDALVADYWRRTGGKPGRRTDKLPHNFRNVGLIGVLFPNSPIIYLQRDVRDVALSIYARPFPDGHAYACDLTSLGHFCAQAQRLHDHWRCILGRRLLDVSYEQLVSDPEPLARSMVEFCGLRWDPACLAFHERTESSFTFSELQVREALHDRGVGRWRRYEEHLQPFLEAYRRAAGE